MYTHTSVGVCMITRSRRNDVGLPIDPCVLVAGGHAERLMLFAVFVWI